MTSPVSIFEAATLLTMMTSPGFIVGSMLPERTA